MVTAHRGTTRLGCLVSLLFVVFVGYFGFNIGEVYLRFYRLQDRMEQEARYASNKTDDQIRAHLAAVADSLGLPHEAGRITIIRNANRIVISSQYSETVELPLFVRDFRFTPQVIRTF